MKCPRCHQENPAQASFCMACGAGLSARAKRGKVGGAPSSRRTRPTSEGAQVQDLEKRLADALGQLQTRDRELAEAQEQQRATSEILGVISRSPTDIQPVLDTVAKSAAHLCEAYDTSIFRLDGDRLRRVAHHGPIPAGVIGEFTLPLVRGSFAGRSVLDGRIVHMADGQTESNEFPEGSEMAQRLGFRGILIVPLLREGVAIGAITLRRTEARLFTERQVALLQTFADQAVIAIENVRLFTELEARNRDLIATSEILQAISRSPTDVQPVFDAIVKSATRLCNGLFSAVYRYGGEVIHLVAHHNFSPAALAAAQRTFPMPPSRGGAVARAVLTCEVVHIADLRLDPEYAHQALARDLGFPSILAVPMLRDGMPIGAIAVAGAEAAPFSDTQIAVLKTFADQAVIAIENVRLFTELEARNRDLAESLEQQTATSEILRVLSSSPTDVQPVFDAITESAARLCGVADGWIVLTEGDTLRGVSAVGQLVGQLPVYNARRVPLTRESVIGRAILDRTTIQIDDLAAASEAEYPEGRALQRMLGHRTQLVTPLLRKGVAIGAILLARFEVRLFSERQIELLKTFADQAVIAIENVRLFTELQEKNRALTQAHAQVSEALERQTATSEILGMISSSPTDVQPVFDSLVASAARLCGANDILLLIREGDVLRPAAGVGAFWGSLATDFRVPLVRGSVAARSVIDSTTLHIPDLAVVSEADFSLGRDLQRRFGHRTVLAVPLFREGVALGTIFAMRFEVRPFADQQIALLKTFADQAVIAIENVRLFTELQARTAELTRSVEELTALGDVGRALSSTLDLDRVLRTIVGRANDLAGTAGCTIWEYDEDRGEFRLRASHYAAGGDAAILGTRDRVTTISSGQGVTTRVVESRQPVQIHDITAEGAYDSPLRSALIQAGHRALLGVPLLLEKRVIGVLAVTSKTQGEFPAETVRLLSTFAIQSALAIQNARLFREIEQKSRELAAASQHKSEFLANMSHELRTPLNAIIGFSEVLSERMFGELNEKQDEYLRDIHASGQHLLSLINDILDLSKIEAGRMELELSDFDLPTALDNALTLVRERAGRREIALQIKVDDRLGQVRADERKIRQVVLNLLSNAIKFTPERGRIEVAATSKDGSVEVSVSDTGVGIAPEDQEAVFEEFRQVGTAEKKAEGTGLGLTLCRKFIELHGGRIWVKSQVGAGSTFTFTIPMRRAE